MQGCRDCTLVAGRPPGTLGRVVAQAAQAGDFDKCKKLLSTTNELYFKHVSKDDAAFVQKRVLVENLTTLAKVDTDHSATNRTKVAGAIAAMRSFLDALPLGDGEGDEPGYIADPDCRSLSVPKLRVVAEINEAEEATDRSMKDNSRLFHKVLGSCAAGVQARVEAGAFFEQVRADAGRVITLSELSRAMAQCSAPTINDCLVGKGASSTVRCPSEAMWADMHSKIVDMTTNGSAMFLEAHSASIDALRKLQGDLVKSVLGAAKVIFSQSADRVAKALEKISGVGKGGAGLQFEVALAMFHVVTAEDL